MKTSDQFHPVDTRAGFAVAVSTRPKMAPSKIRRAVRSNDTEGAPSR
jgi:hypothetical protein